MISYNTLLSFAVARNRQLSVIEPWMLNLHSNNDYYDDNCSYYEQHDHSNDNKDIEGQSAFSGGTWRWSSGGGTGGGIG